jgi:isoquinoline 1-oxidoreductase subunit beta
MTLNTSRRNFLKGSAALSGGLAIGFHIDVLAQGKAAHPIVVPEANAWVVVRPDDTIIIRYARAEMGQGSMTSAPMLVAEELEANWNKVKVEYARANEQVRRKRAWGDMAAVGSRTIRNSQEYLRRAGAGAREMLVTAAAARWKVPITECVAASSVITHTPTGRKLTYGQVALDAAKVEAPKDPKIKDPKDFKLVGKSIRRIDIPDIVTGKIRYGIDAQVPGMLYASVAACPVFGGKVKSVDESKIAGRRGIVKVLQMGDFVAVVADNWWRADQALKALPIEWDVGVNGAVNSASIMDFFKVGLTQPDIAVARKGGDTEKAFADAAKVVESEYFTPFLSHTTMEPMVCTAIVKDGRVEVWTSSQNYEATLATAANTAGVPLENVEAHPMQLGGGLGRRGAQDYTRQGVMIAKAMEGTAVKMVWSREEDTQHDFYRPASLVKMKGSVDAQGNITGLYSRISSPSIIATLLKLPLKGGIDPQAVTAYADQPYSIPNISIEYAQRNPHVPVGFWRTVGHSQNPFVRECFIDELAQAAGKDPYEFRRAMLKDSPRDLAILDATAKAAEWNKPLPAGVFRGIAETEGYGSYTACVAEVSVNAKNELKIHRMVIGIDCGIQVNPDNIIAQVQGSAVHGLTAIIWGEITIKDGRVEQGNFHDNRMMMLKEMPKVEVVMAPTGGFWGGIGEPAQAAIPPALINAIAAATGKRIRSLPLKNHGMTLA